MSDIVRSVVAWGSLDVAWLDNFIDAHNLDSDDIADYKEEIFYDSDCSNINDYVWCALDRAYDNFKLQLINYAEENNIAYDADEFEPNIYTNYLDSGYDSILQNYDIVDFSDKNLQKFIDEVQENKIKG